MTRMALDSSPVVPSAMARKAPKRPRDPNQLARHILGVATGEIDEADEPQTAAQEFARRGGLKGGSARAEKLTPARRKEIASKAAAARWAKK